MAENTDTGRTGRMRTFSVPLGLLDYINPIFYTVTTLTILRHMGEFMGPLASRIYMAGALLSLIGGYIIPTGKLIVGLGLIRFVMPVPLVFAVNSGILVSGLVLLGTVFSLPVPVTGLLAGAIALGLVLVLKRTGKFNTLAVLTGAAGYLMIYASLIALSLGRGLPVPVALYALAVCLFAALVLTGCRADLYDARVHWFIEISNVLCQGAVALGTLILFGAL